MCHSTAMTAIAMQSKTNLAYLVVSVTDWMGIYYVVLCVEDKNGKKYNILY